MQQTIRTRPQERLTIYLLCAALCAAVVCSLALGRYPITVNQLLSLINAFISGTSPDISEQSLVVLYYIRIPRILLSLMVGGALAAAGAAYQGLFRNPMVSPDILGVTSAAALGAAVALLLDLPAFGMHALAFLCGVGAVCLVMLIAKTFSRDRTTNFVMLILSGIVISALFGAILSLIKYIADSEQKLPEIVFWLMGSFARSGNYHNIAIMAVALIAGLVPLFLIRWKINALAFGEEEAQALGVNIRRIAICIIACSTILSAASVSLCGSIGWVGLLIPHISRFLVGPNYRVLLPVSVLLGALFMLVVDTICRIIIPGELPVGIITSILGAPLFLYLLLKTRGTW